MQEQLPSSSGSDSEFARLAPHSVDRIHSWLDGFISPDTTFSDTELLDEGTACSTEYETPNDSLPSQADLHICPPPTRLHKRRKWLHEKLRNAWHKTAKTAASLSFRAHKYSNRPQSVDRSYSQAANETREDGSPKVGEDSIWRTILVAPENSEDGEVKRPVAQACYVTVQDERGTLPLSYAPKRPLDGDRQQGVASGISLSFSPWTFRRPSEGSPDLRPVTCVECQPIAPQGRRIVLEDSSPGM
ncbi:hypothetical protein NliqN6_5367 [Naganishia liquefaciens]|uniref:Uncharacterized protein n=1 Tax=Naganishia liquefaciens TaxID=104408 RepID=A0A8H3TY36_9TREE|nr:hypothetical protein NliqN6_5367 [Naganishia liquefaciens]